ncbi:hypothetical protein K1719_010503 [Acacia pycnantha]|nr:hypothetical protein K1719_010503 [Acacia pycnantha]
MEDNAHDKVQQVFTDFTARRSALVKALTDDADVFFWLCDPDAGSALYLMGESNGRWSVEAEVPVDVVPPEIPEPSSGINLVRDTMPKKQWLSLVSDHSDAWLRSVASFLGSMHGLRQSDREQLHDMIEDLPILSEVVDNYHI